MITTNIFDNEEVKRYTDLFEDQLTNFKARYNELISQNPDITDEELFKQDSLIRDEVLTQCNNIDYSNLGLYLPYLAVTNMGRVWNIRTGIWLVPTAEGSNQDYWRINSSYNGKDIKILVHRLVKYYYLDDSDMVCLKHYDSTDIEIHHKRESHIPKKLKGKGYVEEKIWNCMQINKASNLQIIDKSYHKDCTNIMNGSNTDYIDADIGTRVFMNTMGHFQNPENEIAVIYSEDENGKVSTVVHKSLHIQSNYKNEDQSLSKNIAS